MSAAVINAPKAKPAPTNREKCETVQCQIKFEKYKGGFKIRCRVDQPVCAEFQSLCQAACNGTLSCCCKQNDTQICKFDFSKTDCKCENTKDGCCITCTSDDAQYGKTLQACCECMEICCKNDGCCYVSFGNTCCCRGTCSA
jgi:hypothetical protein